MYWCVYVLYIAKVLHKIAVRRVYHILGVFGAAQVWGDAHIKTMYCNIRFVCHKMVPLHPHANGLKSSRGAQGIGYSCLSEQVCSHRCA